MNNNSGQALAMRRVSPPTALSFFIHPVVLIVAGSLVISCVSFLQNYQLRVHVAELSQQVKVLSPNTDTPLPPHIDDALKELYKGPEANSARELSWVNEALSIGHEEVSSNSGSTLPGDVGIAEAETMPQQENESSVSLHHPSIAEPNMAATGGMTLVSHSQAPNEKQPVVHHSFTGCYGRHLHPMSYFGVAAVACGACLIVYGLWALWTAAYQGCNVVASLARAPHLAETEHVDDHVNTMGAEVQACLTQHIQASDSKQLLVCKDEMSAKIAEVEARLSQQHQEEMKKLIVLVSNNEMNTARLAQQEEMKELIVLSNEKMNTKIAEVEARLEQHQEEMKNLIVHAACDAGDNTLDMVKALLECAGVDVTGQDEDGMTALHFAAMREHVAVVQLLLGHAGVEVDAKNNDGKTPLMLAAVQGHVDTVKALLDMPEWMPMQGPTVHLA
ncbi:ankyrin 3, node of Ranvier (ankyrin G) [Seminavis robusta]|uniref:Ankyrin 3, node of Ranvier (Ankyrin G) n=1 Tax=Seminavis robusta TaxID=568900 RepID=A0A9N8DIT4_9STRA|nr:ankyrin 3, node of Ranvier (ankyrin G) [Seminavis robusta]|eukprot:Sro111_g055220.1 ankyrin 3, node of Ranvier (ankyrin G) (446) ;mRNA; r:40105-41442